MVLEVVPYAVLYTVPYAVHARDAHLEGGGRGWQAPCSATLLDALPCPQPPLACRPPHLTPPCPVSLPTSPPPLPPPPPTRPPVPQVAIEPKTKGDLDKMTNGLIKLAQEDPSFHFR